MNIKGNVDRYYDSTDYKYIYVYEVCMYLNIRLMIK